MQEKLEVSSLRCDQVAIATFSLLWSWCFEKGVLMQTQVAGIKGNQPIPEKSNAGNDFDDDFVPCINPADLPLSNPAWPFPCSWSLYPTLL